jgi:hypothetical protein
LKKGKPKLGVTDEEISQLLERVAGGAPSSGVEKLTGKDVKLTITSDEGSMFVVTADSPGGLRVITLLDLRTAVIAFIQFFEQKAAHLRIPANEWRAYATDRTSLVLNIMLDRVTKSFADALDLLSNESLIVASHFAQHHERGEIPPLPARSVGALTQGMINALKMRVSARGPGAQGVSLIEIMQKVLKCGGEDARAKDVARALGLSERRLRNVRAEWGFDGWEEFVGFVVNLVERK